MESVHNVKTERLCFAFQTGDATRDEGPSDFIRLYRISLQAHYYNDGLVVSPPCLYISSNLPPIAPGRKHSLTGHD